MNFFRRDFIKKSFLSLMLIKELFAKEKFSGRWDNKSFNKTKKALLVIDVQNDYFDSKLKVTYPSDSFSNILKLMDFANEKDIPTILIRHTALEENAKFFKKNSHGWQIHKDILNKKYNAIIEKNYPNSFHKTNLKEYLDKFGIDSLIICGYMTQMCCNATAIEAFHLGYDVEFILDGTGTLSFSNSAGDINAKELHKAILITQAMKFSKVLTTKKLINSL